MNLSCVEEKAFQEVKRLNDNFQLGLNEEVIRDWIAIETEYALKRQHYINLTEKLSNRSR